MARYTAPRTVGLGIDDWPRPIRDSWLNALEPGDIFDNPGRLSHLKPKTQTTVLRSVEKWLFFLSENNRLNADTRLVETYSKENLKEYIALLRGRLKARSLTTQLRSLSQAFNALCPDLDRSLLQYAIGKLRSQTETKRIEEKQLPSLQQLLELADKLMDNWKGTELTI